VSTAVLNPALLLEALGGFSESRYLSLFQGVNRSDLAKVLRGLNATEIAHEGSSALAMDVILAPLENGRFPRALVDKVAHNAHGADDCSIGAELTPLMLAYLASMSLYANMVTEENVLCSAEKAAGALYAISRDMGTLWGVELLRFYLWCFTLRTAKSAERSPFICIAFAFLLIADLLISTSTHLERLASLDGETLAEQAVNERFLGLLRREYLGTLGPDGTLSAAAQRAMDAVVGAV
jgi:hypothetical protein